MRRPAVGAGAAVEHQCATLDSRRQLDLEPEQQLEQLQAEQLELLGQQQQLELQQELGWRRRQVEGQQELVQRRLEQVAQEQQRRLGRQVERQVVGQLGGRLVGQQQQQELVERREELLLLRPRQPQHLPAEDVDVRGQHALDECWVELAVFLRPAEEQQRFSHVGQGLDQLQRFQPAGDAVEVFQHHAEGFEEPRALP